MRNILFKSVALGMLMVTSAQAATNVLDFNTDPVVGGLYTEPGGQSATWIPTGGNGTGANDGYLVVTAAANGQAGLLVFKDLEAGLVVKAFKFECDLRIGGGANRPADGFSVNYAADDDPATTAGGQFNGTDNEPAPSALAEEGTQTGLAIGFDTWQSNPIKGVQDVVGLSIRVDGAVVAQLPVPLRQGNTFLPTMPNPGAQGTNYVYDEVPYRNLATNNANYPFSLQTGARNTTDDLNGDGVVDTGDYGAGGDADGAQQPTDPANPLYGLFFKNLKWEHFSAELTEDGRVILFWKGRELTPAGGLQTSFTPRPGRIILAGRTGGSREVHHVDNIRLVTIPADFLIIGAAAGNPVGFSIKVINSGPAVLDTNQITLKFNDVAVTPKSVTRDTNGVSTTIQYYNLSSPLTAGTTNKVSLSLKDTRGQTVSADRSFVVPAYQTLPAQYAVTGVDTASPGFNLKWYQVAVGPLAAFENTVARAEQELYGMRGANTFTTPTEAVTDVINYDQLGAAAGNWTANTPNAGDYTDKAMPLADPSYTDNIAAEIQTYIRFPEAGVYNLIFNSDDGFRTTIGGNVKEVLTPFLVSQFDGGRGAGDTVATLFVPTPGFFPARSVWFEGQGGASFEWVAEETVPTATGRALINDALKPNSIKAYRTRTGTTPAAVTFIQPFTSSGSPYLPTITLIAELEQGTDAINQASITMTLNGTAVNATKTTSGAKTTLRYDPPGNLAAGTYTNVISFTAGTQQYVGTNTFTVRAVPAIPPSLALPASAVDKTKVGFLVKTRQQNSGESMANETYRGLVQAAGLIGFTNTADLTAFTGPGGYFVETGVINYTGKSADAAGFFNAAAGFTDNGVPGIPGTATSDAGTDNYVNDILTVLDLKAGIYAMNANTDDGFWMMIGNPLETFTTPIVPGVFSGGRGVGNGIGNGTTFYFEITQAGLYPVRMITYEGGGGSGIEWSSVGLDSQGNLTTYQLINDLSTATGVPAYQYPLTSAGAPYVESFEPARTGRGNRAGTDTPIKVVLVDGVNPVSSSISLALDNVPVTLPAGAVTKSGTRTTVNYQPPAPFAAGSAHTAALTFGDRTVSRSFTINSSNLNTASFFIEAEDFNYGGGQTKPEASVMPYVGGAYAGLTAVDNVDYHRNDQADSPVYRVGVNPRVPMDRTTDRDRGLSEIIVNYKLGWIGTGMWYNYTRTFPAGNYNVYAGLSHGDAPTTATRVTASLQRVTSNATQPNQTVADLGTFNAPATGGWGNNAMVPLKDASSNLVSLNLSGPTTLRMVPTNGDFDFILFTPVGVTGPRFNAPTFAGGSVTLTWVGTGTLQQATALTGSTNDWTNVSPPPSTNSYTATGATSGNKYFRLKQ